MAFSDRNLFERRGVVAPRAEERGSTVAAVHDRAAGAVELVDERQRRVGTEFVENRVEVYEKLRLSPD